MCQMIKKFSENTDKTTYPNSDIPLPNDNYKQVIIYSDMTGMKLNYPQDPKNPTERSLPSILNGDPSFIYLKQKQYISNLFLNKTEVSFNTWKETDEKIVWSYTSPIYNITHSSSYNEKTLGGDYVGITNKGNVLFIQGHDSSYSGLDRYDIILYKVINDDMPLSEWFIESCVNPLFGICSNALKPFEECQSSRTPFVPQYCKIERRDHINIIIAILCEMIRQYHLHFKHEGFTHIDMSCNKNDSLINRFSIYVMIVLGVLMIVLIFYILFHQKIKRKKRMNDH